MVTVRQDGDPGGSAPPSLPLGRVACAGLGVAAAVLGLLPWLVTGMRLPLQNLWATPTLPADMPVALLPFSQYAVTSIVALVVTGYGATGLVVRALGARSPSRAVLAAGAGASAVHLIAAVESTAAVASGLAERTASSVYLAALVVVVVVAVLTGVLVLRLVTARSRAAAVVGLSVLALVLGPWSASFVAPLGAVPGEVASWALTRVLRWVPAVLVGGAIAWAGLGTRRRVAAATGAVLLLWTGPAAATAVTSAAGFRLLLPHPAELLAYGIQVLQAALLQPEVVVPPVLVALAVAAAGVWLRRVLAGRGGRGAALARAGA